MSGFAGYGGSESDRQLSPSSPAIRIAPTFALGTSSRGRAAGDPGGSPGDPDAKATAWGVASAARVTKVAPLFRADGDSVPGYRGFRSERVIMKIRQQHRSPLASPRLLI